MAFRLRHGLEAGQSDVGPHTPNASMRQCGYCPKALLGRVNLPSFHLRCRDPDPFARRMIAEPAHDTQSHPTRRRLGVWIGSYTESWKSLSDGEGRFLVNTD